MGNRGRRPGDRGRARRSGRADGGSRLRHAGRGPALRSGGLPAGAPPPASRWRFGVVTRAVLRAGRRLLPRAHARRAALARVSGARGDALGPPVRSRRSAGDGGAVRRLSSRPRHGLRQRRGGLVARRRGSEPSGSRALDHRASARNLAGHPGQQDDRGRLRLASGRLSAPVARPHGERNGRAWSGADGRAVRPQHAADLDRKHARSAIARPPADRAPRPSGKRGARRRLARSRARRVRAPRSPAAGDARRVDVRRAHRGHGRGQRAGRVPQHAVLRCGGSARSLRPHRTPGRDRDRGGAGERARDARRRASHARRGRGLLDGLRARAAHLLESTPDRRVVPYHGRLSDRGESVSPQSRGRRPRMDAGALALREHRADRRRLPRASAGVRPRRLGSPRARGGRRFDRVRRGRDDRRRRLRPRGRHDRQPLCLRGTGLGPLCVELRARRAGKGRLRGFDGRRRTHDLPLRRRGPGRLSRRPPAALAGLPPALRPGGGHDAGAGAPRLRGSALAPRSQYFLDARRPRRLGAGR